MLKWIKNKFKNACIKINNRIECSRRRKILRVKDFSILSNNCWAGSAVYVPFGLKVNTPTYDLAIMDEDYMKFLSNLDYYLNLDMKFISPKDARYYQERMTRSKTEITYPVGLLDDIEIWFTHYTSPEQAKKLWEKRKKRINKDRILVKWSERFGNGDEHLKKFIELPYRNKIAFVTTALKRKYPDLDYIVGVPEFKFLNMRGGDETEFTLRQKDINELLNTIK